MAPKYKSSFSTQRKFRDITAERPDVVETVANSTKNDAIVRIYECKETAIIHSKSPEINHASLSNAKGQIDEWEIVYAIEHILKESNENIIMLVGNNGVIHLNVKGKERSMCQ